jgi:hypothetical protein
MNTLPLIFILFLLSSACNNEPQNKIDAEKSYNTPIDSSGVKPKDTTISYDIEGISSEGAQAIAKYVKNQIKECAINVYSERGQIRMIYVFERNKIEVEQRDYFYKTYIGDVKSDDDMLLKKNIKYTMDYSGNIIGNDNSGRLDIFQDFKTVVPFNL